MDRISACNGCPNDGRCQYQESGDCQACNENLNNRG